MRGPCRFRSESTNCESYLDTYTINQASTKDGGNERTDLPSLDESYSFGSLGGKNLIFNLMMPQNTNCLSYLPVLYCHIDCGIFFFCEILTTNNEKLTSNWTLKRNASISELSHTTLKKHLLLLLFRLWQLPVSPYFFKHKQPFSSSHHGHKNLNILTGISVCFH